MGEIADMMIDGTLCEGCGIYLEDEAPGHPRRCADCGPSKSFIQTNQPSSKKHECKECGKRFKKKFQLEQHTKDKHKQEDVNEVDKRGGQEKQQQRFKETSPLNRTGEQPVMQHRPRKGDT